MQVLKAANPIKHLQELFEEDVNFLPVYKTILVLTSSGTPITAQQLNATLREHPMLKDANLLPAHFVEKLEKRDALTWKKGWLISEAGKEILNDIQDVEVLYTEIAEPPAITDEEMEETFIDPFDSLEG